MMLKKLILLFILNISVLICQTDENILHQYYLKYGMLTIGRAELSFQDSSGTLLSHLFMYSTGMLDKIWSVSDTIKSEYLLDSKQLIFHSKAVNEGKYHKRFQLRHNENAAKVLSSKSYADLSSYYDLLSFLHSMRHQNIQTGDTLSSNFVDGANKASAHFIVSESKVLKTARGKQNALKFTPYFESDKARKNDINVSMWFSESMPHLPLQLDIGSKYGDFVLILRH